ncbi:hypothetical protein CGCFRS4_v015202 [Colletotrichum fructicola]|nr:hypothetical protein CGCFRS4_v015202 [Colletotrichum fructicola]
MDVWTSQFDITANDIFTQKLVAKSQVTPLHVASAYGLNVVVKRILKDTPAAVEATDVHGRTPLCYAIRCPLTAVSTIRLLLRHQAKTNDCILLDDLEGRRRLATPLSVDSLGFVNNKCSQEESDADRETDPTRCRSERRSAGIQH